MPSNDDKSTSLGRHMTIPSLLGKRLAQETGGVICTLLAACPLNSADCGDICSLESEPTCVSLSSNE